MIRFFHTLSDSILLSDIYNFLYQNMSTGDTRAGAGADPVKSAGIL